MCWYAQTNNMQPRNAWIAHVQKVRAAGNLTYKEALTTASATYRSQGSAAAVSRARYGSGFADNMWNKREAVNKILNAIEHKNYEDFEKALLAFDRKLWSGMPNIVKSLLNESVETLTSWSPMGWAALASRVRTPTPELLALMVYLHIHDLLKKKLAEEKKKLAEEKEKLTKEKEKLAKKKGSSRSPTETPEYDYGKETRLLRKTFNAASDYLADTGKQIAHALALGGVGYKFRKLKAVHDSSKLAHVRRAWEEGLESLPPEIKRGTAYTTMLSLVT